jgi:hypothetical protein
VKIAFFHYHLRPGGVTSVIQHQLAALEGVAETAVIASSPPDRSLGTTFLTVPEAGYDLDLKKPASSLSLARAIWQAVHSVWPQGCDVLHVHNPTLVKNRSLIPALCRLRDWGVKLFLQIHDFAEDGRPSAFNAGGYVQDVHYGVINQRDYRLLIEAGLKPQGLHMIANMVRPFDFEPSGDSGFILYPVRAIRRKNIGEALLLSMFLPEGAQVGITMPPQHPADRTIYRQWQKFVSQHNLPLAFEVARHTPFTQLVKQAKCVVSTSLNEGFGFSFLEPWTAGKEVFGRYLDHACDDFQEKGIALDHLYSALQIPLTSFDVAAFQQRWQHSLSRFASSFGQDLDPSILEAGFAALTSRQTIDFGYLEEEFQRSVIESLLVDRNLRTILVELNPQLRQMVQFNPDQERISKNRQIIVNEFGMDGYRTRLLKIYQQVCQLFIAQRIDQQKLLNYFLKPKNYYMPKWRRFGEQ